MIRIIIGIVAFAFAAGTGWSAPQDAPPPAKKELKKLVKRYLAAGIEERRTIREEADKTYAPLKAGPDLVKLRKTMLKLASKVGPKFRGNGSNYFFPKTKSRDKTGLYISRKGNKALWLGLHGGGEGQGSASSAAGSMGGGGWAWIFPEVIEKTEYGWTDSGTEEFVMDLLDAAKRTGKFDPNRIYISGHSMGGYGTWTLGAHHADVFGGGAAYAGAPTPIWEDDKRLRVVGIQPGVLPSYFQLPLYFFQSLDDKNVPPASNVRANQELVALKKEFPDGFNFRYTQVERNGHAAPKEGYLPTQRWIASHPRIPRPKKFLWQPVLDWKRHFYWIYWQTPALRTLLQCEMKGDNVFEIDVLEGQVYVWKGFSVLLGEPLIDLDKEVVINVNGTEKFRGKVERTFSTLLLTLPRHDEYLLFDARADLE